MPDHTAFIGRARESAEIRQLLAKPACRLLSLVGPGGIGKTRLALQVSDMVGRSFAHGSFIVYLQPLRSSELFCARSCRRSRHCSHRPRASWGATGPLSGAQARTPYPGQFRASCGWVTWVS